MVPFAKSVGLPMPYIQLTLAITITSLRPESNALAADSRSLSKSSFIAKSFSM